MNFNSTFRTTEAKIEIRKKIVAHFKKLFRLGLIDTVSMLPGEYWEVEKQIIRIVEKAGKEILLQCFEHNSREKMLQFAPRRLPRWVEKSWDSEYEYCQGFNWADYCGPATKAVVTRLMKSVTLNNVVYVTFCTTPRGRKGINSIEGHCRRAMTYPDTEARALILLRALEKKIRKKRGRNFTRILFRSYRSPRHHMVTMGWHFTRRSPLKSVAA
jgi:hypothetical protein